MVSVPMAVAPPRTLAGLSFNVAGVGAVTVKAAFFVTPLYVAESVTFVSVVPAVATQQDGEP